MNNNIFRCRICGSKTELWDTLENQIIDPVSYFNEPVNTNNNTYTCKIEIYKCFSCNHFQINNSLDSTYYDNYNIVYNPTNSQTSSVPQTLLNNYKELFLNRLYKYSHRFNSLLDVGCNDGEITVLHKNVYDRLYGIEPSRSACCSAHNKGINVINGYFTTETVFDEKFDAISALSVIEHIDDISSFMKAVYKNLQDDGLFMLTVPNGQKILADKSYSDVFSEHLNYFSLYSVFNLANRNGFEAVSVEECFGNNYYICAIFRKRYSESLISQKKSDDSKIINQLLSKYNHIGVWGIGVRSRNLLNLLTNDNLGKIHCLLDSNKSIYGKYLSVCSVPIACPNMEIISKCDCIFVSSVEYYAEIVSKLKEEYGYTNDVIIIKDGNIVIYN